jgi:hypothetical protein
VGLPGAAGRSGDGAAGAQKERQQGLAFLGSGALWYVSRATGVVAMVLLAMVVVLGVVVSRRVRVPGLPRFAVAEPHRRVSLIAVVFLALHVLSAVTDPAATCCRLATPGSRQSRAHRSVHDRGRLPAAVADRVP